MRLMILISILALFTTGCSKAVENFVRGAVPERTPPVEQIGANSLREGLKLSPGAVVSAGGASGVEMTLTPSQQALKGSSLGARVGILQNSMIH